MKRFFTLFCTVLLVSAVAAPTLAWEFSMTGDMEVRYRYFSRTGGGDLYGAANETAIGFNNGAIGLSGYYGGTNAVEAQGFSVKGSDAALSDMRVRLYPELRLNQAIRVRGEYWLTGGNLHGSYDGSGSGPIGGDSWAINRGEQGWYSPTDTGAKIGMSSGIWDKLWVTAHLPWGILVAGRRGLMFGPGWSTLDEQNASDEMLAIAVPYGPFTLLCGELLYENCWIVPNSAEQLSTNSRVAAPRDKNGARDLNGFWAFTYRSGDIDTGTAARYAFQKNVHSYGTGTVSVLAGPNMRDDASNFVVPAAFNGTALNGLPMTSDVNIWEQVVYAKYYNGRFFFNGEYGAVIVDAFRQGGRPISGWQDAWMVELGVVAGPTKLSLANFYKSGHDRRGGLLNTTAAVGSVSGTYVLDRWDEFMVFCGSNTPIKPYNYLLGLYGCGNNGFDAKGDAWYTDLLAYAVRLDYALAANLNVYGSYIHASRASKTSTAIGQYRGGVSNATYRVNPGYNASGAQIAAVPNVPDTYLGYEVDAGFDWKLLEGFTFNMLFAYWQPGDWFKWAYVDYTNYNNVTIGGNNYPVNPHRQIDPLIGLQGSMVISF
jgi:hypothetical protein